MPAAAWALFLMAAGLAEVLGTMAGFGAATILTPVAALFMDMKTAIVVVAGFHFFGNGARLVFFGRSIHWKTWVQFGLTGVALSVLGARITTHLSSAAVTLLFGLFLLAYVGGSALAPGRVRLPGTPLMLAGGGAVSGFIAGLIGTGGAIRSVCLLAFGLPKEVYLGTSAAIALVVDGTRLPIYLAGGLLPPQMAPVLVSLIAVAFAGAWVGQRLVRRVSVQAFRRLVRAMLALAGLKLLVDGWHGLA